MPPTETPPAAITPQGVRDGDPAVLAALAARRGPAVLAFAKEVCEPRDVVRAAADAFARFRAEVADPSASVDVHPDALLLRHARRAALDLAARGPDLGCGPAADLLLARAEKTISTRDAALLGRHLESCEHCRELSGRLETADRAYRDTEDESLDPSALAPMVAALAAAAPIRTPEPSPNGDAVLSSGSHTPQEQDATAEPEEEPAPEPDPEPEPEPEPEPAPLVPEPPVRSAEDTPMGTRRVSGAPSSYYELPPLPPRERGKRVKAGAAAAASLRRKAGAAARKRLDRESPAEAEQTETQMTADPDTRTWAPVESIEFPAQPASPDPFVAEPTPFDEPELRESAARAAARHYRRLRHSQQREAAVPSDGRPPRLTRPLRDRGPHLPLSAHGPRDLALPGGLLVVAVLVIMAVSGVFGGGTETPNTGTSAAAPPEVSLVTQSATSISLSDAEQIASRVPGSTAP